MLRVVKLVAGPVAGRREKKPMFTRVVAALRVRTAGNLPSLGVSYL